MRLEDYKKRNPFNTPDRYFEKLNREIIANTSNTSLVKKRISIGLWAKALGNVAMLAFVVLIAFQALDRESNNMPIAEHNEEGLNNEMIDNILSTYPIDDYMFYTYLTDTDID